MHAAAQEGGDVARPLGYRNNLDGAAFGAINDEVCANSPEQNRIKSQIFAPMPDTWRTRNGFKGIKQFSGPPVRGVKGCRPRCTPKYPRDREPPLQRGCNRSRTRFPALLGFALQSGAGLGRVDGFAAIQGGEAAAELPVKLC